MGTKQMNDKKGSAFDRLGANKLFALSLVVSLAVSVILTFATLTISASDLREDIIRNAQGLSFLAFQREFWTHIAAPVVISLIISFIIFFVMVRNLFLLPYQKLNESRKHLREAKQQAENIASIPKNNPNPQIQIDLDGNILFANVSAMEKFPNIFEEKFNSHLLIGLDEYIQEVKEGRDLPFSREIPFQDIIYHQTISPVPVDGKMVLIIYNYDITSIKKVQEKARLLETVIETAKDGVIITDADLENGPHILYVNEAFTWITGYDPEEVIGQTPRIFQGPATSRKTLGELKKALEQGKPFKGELFNYSKDNIGYWLDISITPVRDDNGVITHYAAIERNITERKAFEKELMVTRESAEVANRAKGNFLANMSHELRTPMNGIIGLSKLLIDAQMDEESKESVKSINSAAEGLLSLLNDLLDFSKIEAGELSLEEIPMSLRDSVEQVVDLVKPISSRKGLKIDVSFGSTAPRWVKGDPNRLRQIFYNLIGNAVKFTEKGGIHVDVSTYSYRGEDMVRCRVEDTGIGIPEDVRDMIFEKFTQADVSTARKFGGTGLGLAITKQLVEMMGGRIGVESVVGQGSSFWFDIPFEIIENHSEEDAPKTPDQIVTSFEGYSALVVDDHPTNILFMKKLLKKLNFSLIETAHDGHDALEKFSKDKYSVILMDCQMPGMDGFEASRSIREVEAKSVQEKTPIIAVTADAMKGTHERCLDAGMDYYVTKPISMPQVKEALSMFLRPMETLADEIPEQDDPMEQLVVIRDSSEMPVDLDHLRQFTDGNPEEEKEFFDIFFSQADESLGVLKQNCFDEYNEDWRKAAHKLKGSAANLGANTLSLLCKDAEFGAEKPSKEKLEIMTAIESELSKVEAYLRSLHN